MGLAESKKVRDVSKVGGSGGSPEKRPYDVSHEQIDMWRFPKEKSQSLFTLFDSCLMALYLYL